jgi:hypothetical protein
MCNLVPSGALNQAQPSRGPGSLTKVKGLRRPAKSKFPQQSAFCRIVAAAWGMRDDASRRVATSLILKPHVVADLGL